MRFAGLDEAGRGPVLGPLVVAGVLADREDAYAELGLKDSKQLTRAKREELYDRIVECSTKVTVRLAQPDQLDARMAETSLNEVEVDLFTDVLMELEPEHAWVDACDVNAERFGHTLRDRLTHPCAIVSRHKADAHFPIVSAASIVAKVVRDRAMDDLAREFGQPLGSGYPSDPTTIKFLKEWMVSHGRLPSCARTRWGTARRLIPKNHTLAEFG